MHRAHNKIITENGWKYVFVYIEHVRIEGCSPEAYDLFWVGEETSSSLGEGETCYNNSSNF